MMMASNSRVWHIICLLLIVVLLCPFAYSKIIYVDDDAVGNNDGSSWQNAYTFLQDALADADIAEKPVEIHIAQGIYKPDQGVIQTLGDRTATFRLINGVTLKGGYAGAVEPNTIDIELYETILSGDLRGNDIDINDPGDLQDAPHRYDYSWHVVTGSNTDETAVLNGFTITGGYIWVVAYSLGGPPTGGAGMLVASGSPTLIDCTFTGNETGNSGGGLLIYDDSNPMLINCKLIRNNAESGGGVFSSRSSSPTLINCTFSDNYAKRKGGGMYTANGNPKLTNCVFRSNLADGLDTQGGGMYNINCSLELTNSMFSENSAEIGGAICNKDSNTVLNMCEFVRNKASYYGGAIANGGQLIAKVCVFKNNYPGAVKDGGSESVPTFIDCIFSGNSSIYPGGAVSVKTATFYNCLFIGNRAFGDWSTGGAVYSILTASLNNCTFSNNWADNGRALYCYRASVDNCIFWGTEGQIYPDGLEWEYVSADYSNIQGGWPGQGNTDTDPLFADPGYWADADDPNVVAEPNDPNAVWVDGDYHLKSQAGRWDPVSQSWIQDDVTSPCIDAGDPNNPIGHEPFPNGGIINMGAYGGTVEASKSLNETSIYIFWPQQSMVIQTGGIAGVDGTYILSGQFQLTIDFGAGKARFSNVEAIATDHSEPVRKLDPNDFFNLTGLTGTISRDGSIQFTGRTADESNVLLYITLSDEWISLKGQTTPPPNSADFFIFDLDAVAQRKYGGGTGELNDPYLIYTVEHLNTIGAEPNDWNKHFKLMADIDLSGYSYDKAVIAPDLDPCDLSFIGTSFTGVLDGNSHKISNLTITGESYLGLFGRLETGAEVKNLGIVDVNITGSDYLGGIVGFSKGNITTSYCTGTITGDKRIGGLTGRNWGSITACYNSAAVTGNDDIGGIAAGNYGSIANSYNTGAVTGNWDVGGLVGENYRNITSSYSIGTVSGETRPGGLIGYNYQDSIITSSFWDVETSGLSTSDGGTSLTTTEMQTAGTFLDAGWDFVNETANGTEDIWWILEGQDYPKLWWETEGN